jgi:hypothetical protein
VRTRAVLAIGRPARLAALLFLVLAVVYTGSIGLRASRGASITGDEPFYLLTTQSLLQDGDLDLTQQYAARSYRSFFDHPDGLWRQSVPRDDGVLLSPHNPGLSLLVLPGFAAAGLLGVQIELLLLTALAFALGFVFVDRVSGRTGLAWWTTLVVGCSATAFVYSTEVYPEAPAALALVIALLLVSGPRPGVWRSVGIVAACSAIPWLGVKYAPLAVVVGAVAVWRASREGRIVIAIAGGVSAAAFVVFHLMTFDGLTPYGLNTVYAGESAAALVGDHLGFADRFYRIWGLFVDRRFGIARWAPFLVLVVPGVVMLAYGRWRERTVAVVIATQIAIATFVAITMMGWWFPGRTMMTVFPLLPLPILAVIRSGGRWAGRLAAALAVWTVAITASLAVGGHGGEVVVAVDPFELGALPFRAFAGLFPSYVSWGPGTIVLTVLWLALIGLAITWAVHRCRIERHTPRELPPEIPTRVPVAAGTG